MSKVIDLDLDFFQNEVVRNTTSRHQTGKNGLRPWNEKKVRNYLENIIGLSAPVKGRVFDTHDNAFYFWKELIESNELTAPFILDHLDAHSDLGYGDGAWHEMLTSYMQRISNNRRICTWHVP